MINVLALVMVTPFPTLEMKIEGITSKRKVANGNRIEKNLWIPVYVPLPTQEERFFEKEINGDRLIMSQPFPAPSFPTLPTRFEIEPQLFGSNLYHRTLHRNCDCSVRLHPDLQLPENKKAQPFS